MPNTNNCLSEVELLLKQRYGVSFADIGIDGQEWLDRFGDQPLVEAVEAYAAKYDLTPLTSAAFTPSSK
ncbi:hypothetical protein HLV39_11015 [Marinobacter adhaerens]|uniref:Uncharacterized protein n=1 Tax=Marinobacter adhaerens TaxID=1033846 RepID=A0A851HXN7_9GAMM|nr:hypothetical protein [Marinobacter adhaerens]NWN92022.1 hypothetical protein [Marinobacter adhaerens]